MEPSQLHAIDISHLETHHNDLLDLCLQLEDIADQAETTASRQDYLRLANLIPALIMRTQTLEEEVLFPDFNRQAGSHFASVIIERLKGEHRCDRLASQELVETLISMAENRCSLAPATMGYMMCGFLESLRRHILSEKLMIEALLAAKSEQREVFG